MICDSRTGVHAWITTASTTKPFNIPVGMKCQCGAVSYQENFSFVSTKNVGIESTHNGDLKLKQMAYRQFPKITDAMLPGFPAQTSTVPSPEPFSASDMIETINKMKEATRVYRYVASFHVDKGNPVYHDVGRYRLFFVNPDDVGELSGDLKPISLEEMLEITRIQHVQWHADALKFDKVDFEKWKEAGG